MSEQLARMPGYLMGHLQLTLVALLAGTLISVPLGVVASRVRWLERVALSVASVFQTIPSLALLAIMVPLMAALNLKSIGYLPALLGLSLYSLLPILRNTVTGLAGVDPAVVQAARAVGMKPSQQLWRVELPLALPVIVAGVRTSTVWVVGIATLSTPIGAASLGNYIFTGLQTRNNTALLLGCVAAATLALILDGLVRLLEVGLQKRRRAIIGIAAVAFLSLYTLVGVSLAHTFLGSAGRLVVGSKTFTEQYVLSEILSKRIYRETGVAPQLMQSLGSTVAFDALGTGDLDAYVDYTGTIWTTIMKRERVIRDREKVLEQTRQYLREHHRIHVVGPLGFENAYALAVRRSLAERLDLKTIGDLGPHAQRLSIGGDYEFFGRPEWTAIQREYGLSFRLQRSMDSSLMYEAAAAGDVDVISAFSTDGRILALDLVVLRDDRRAIPPYDAIILVSDRLKRTRPAVYRALEGLVGTIDATRMRRMNEQVDANGLQPARVAADFLERLEVEQRSGSPKGRPAGGLE